MDVNTNRFTGKQVLSYTNNSPDTLDRVFYHLYYNAFQPGSMMDVRSRTIEDPDRRVGDRIFKLKDDEIGYQKIKSLKQGKKDLSYEVAGTILEVTLNKPILPGKTEVFTMEFEAQVPVQIRRTGRDNDEGVRYTMTQWYPKMAEYDYHGWHANPYIGREFHGIWGDFDVTIHIDEAYLVGGTGSLQNKDEIGRGYTDGSAAKKRTVGEKVEWNFVAKNVHDFAWAADPEFVHLTKQVPDGPMLHFIFQGDTLRENWEELTDYGVKMFQIVGERFGKYPYSDYSFIQGGDGGMEYPMATMITGWRSMRSLVGVSVHEAIHSWYQGMMATNESLYPWMDEGFTTFASAYTMSKLYDNEGVYAPYSGSYRGYFALQSSGKEEPLTTHADHYNTNFGYGVASYNKGAVFLSQLRYIIGEEAFWKGMKDYYNQWRFKHPNLTTFKRVMEKASNIELDWYIEYWVNSTKAIDYSIKSTQVHSGSTIVTLERTGLMPMPVDLVVKYSDGSEVNYHIPLRVMRGAKPAEKELYSRTEVQADWPWTYPLYSLTVNGEVGKDIESITIDPSMRMADIDRENNSFPLSEETTYKGGK